VKKRERKALDKSLQLAQLSTASMGKFDRKVSKKEPDAPTSQKIQKKKGNSQLANISRDPKLERERAMKILSFMQRSDEVKASTAADSHLNVDKMVNKHNRKEQRRNQRDK
jgi:hypothetical protein